MIPNYETKDIIITQQPSRTYCLKNGSISGFIDGAEALKQTIFCILSTQRFIHAIYSRNYGIDRNSYIGSNAPNIYSKIERDITNALLKDDRISSVEGFSFTRNKKQYRSHLK